MTIMKMEKAIMTIMKMEKIFGRVIRSSKISEKNEEKKGPNDFIFGKEDEKNVAFYAFEFILIFLRWPFFFFFLFSVTGKHKAYAGTMRRGKIKENI